MNLKSIMLLSILTSFALLTGFILLYFIPVTRPIIPGFPFQITGGALIGSNLENNSGIVWGQSFNIEIIQKYDVTLRNAQFTVLILNFPTSGVVISGLEDKETFTIEGPLKSRLELTGKTRNGRIIQISNIPDDGSSIKFLTMGDTQGFSDLYEEMISSNEAVESSFILHLGDITASGDKESLQNFQNISERSKIPIYTTPGNHDLKSSNSTEFYEMYFGIAEYFFEYKGFLFISLNSSMGYYSENSFSFLSELLSEFPKKPKVIFTHIPIFDPRPGEDHALINLTQSTRMLTLLNNTNVKAVISGHIHYFSHTIFNGIHFITSGGGGAYLYETPEDGGFHHFAEITINTDTQELTVSTIPLTKLEQETDIIVLKDAVSRIFSLEDILSEFTFVSGNSSFQNQYDNWRANGSYIGIRISDLLETVGGMSTKQWLTVESWDGLTSNFSYSVVYPNSTWYQIQGDMVLAFSFDGLVVPDYVDGYRIVFLPPDGSYSNEDCKNTSSLNEGWNVYPSAGFRWVKYVYSLSINGGG
ncbi:MAG: metallophosphoesterase family protein [Candidatus Hodarchaeales archaeon]|jgi:3',5'-cyclic AMP phosphodiesterase CpdA